MIFLYGALAYFLIGLVSARRVYAVQNHRFNSIPESAEYKRLSAQRASLVHGSSCYQKRGGEYYNARRSCDCSTRQEWFSIKRELESLGDISGAEPQNPYLVMSFWLVFLIDTYLKGGKVRVRSGEREHIIALEQKIKELETECEITT